MREGNRCHKSCLYKDWIFADTLSDFCFFTHILTRFWSQKSHICWAPPVTNAYAVKTFRKPDCDLNFIPLISSQGAVANLLLCKLTLLLSWTKFELRCTLAQEFIVCSQVSEKEITVICDFCCEITVSWFSMSFNPPPSKHSCSPWILLWCAVLLMLKSLTWLPIIGFKATALQPSYPPFIITGNQITKESAIDGATWQRLKCLGESKGVPSLRYL